MYAVSNTKYATESWSPGAIGLLVVILVVIYLTVFRRRKK